jgi:hypothetical protein
MSDTTEPKIFRSFDLASGPDYTVTGSYIDGELVRLEQSMPQRFNDYIEQHKLDVPWRVDAQYWNDKFLDTADGRNRYQQRRDAVAKELEQWLNR